MDIESDLETTFIIADSGIEMKLKHLIALKLFIGDYRFAQLQRMLMDAIRYPLRKNQMRYPIHWKTTLVDCLLLIKTIRNALKRRGDVVFTRDMSMECVLTLCFEENHPDQGHIPSSE